VILYVVVLLQMKIIIIGNPHTTDSSDSKVSTDTDLFQAGGSVE